MAYFHIHLSDVDINQQPVVPSNEGRQPEAKSNASSGSNGLSTLASCTPPNSFEKECVENKIHIILRWIFGLDSYENVLKGKEKITNFSIRLDNMQCGRYLRFFEIDMSIMKDYLTENSWRLFNDFKLKRQADAWKCRFCAVIFNEKKMYWKCARCLLQFHQKCSKARSVKVKGDEYSLCDTCLFNL